MISKVNRPSYLNLVRSGKELRNDPGASSGGPLGYEKQEQPPSEDESRENEKAAVEKPVAKLSVVVSVEQVGMTEVIKDLLENKEELPLASSSGLTTKYSHAGAPSKGLLLNKKVE